MSRARALCARSCCPVGRFTESVSLRAPYGVGRARRSRGLIAFCEDYRARGVCAHLQPCRLIRRVGSRQAVRLLAQCHHRRHRHRFYLDHNRRVIVFIVGGVYGRFGGGVMGRSVTLNRAQPNPQVDLPWRCVAGKRAQIAHCRDKSFFNLL